MRGPWPLLLTVMALVLMALVLSGVLALFLTTAIGQVVEPAWRANPSSWLPVFAIVWIVLAIPSVWLTIRNI